MLSSRARFSANYFFFFLFAGIHVAYWPTILANHHYSDYEIGVITAVFVLLRIIAPGFWGHIADVRQNHKALLIFKALASALSMGLIFYYLDNFIGLLVSSALFGFFFHGLLPLYETATLRYLSGDNHQYNLIRLWGSVSFIVAVMVIGTYLDSLVDYWLYVFLLGSLALLFVFTTFMPSNRIMEQTAAPIEQSFLALLLTKPIAILFIIALLMNMSHGQFYGFFTLSLQNEGYAGWHIGALWAIGVIVEIAVFIYFQQIRAWLSSDKILMLCLLFAAIRWFFQGSFIDNAVIVWAAQILHAFTFGAFHSLMMHYIHHCFPDAFLARAQSFNTAFCYGLGTGIGIYIAGILMEDYGSGISFLFSSLLAALALLVTLIYQKQIKTLS